MQKTGTILAMAPQMLLPVLLVSCVQDDESVASFVDGYWEGELTADFYTYRGYETDYFYTQMQFVRTNAYGGYGVERDYNAYSNIPLYSNFNWSVKDGYIYIDYDQGEDVKHILIENGFKDIEIIKDYADNDRVVFAH